MLRTAPALLLAAWTFSSASAQQDESLSTILAQTGLVPAGTEDLIAQVVFTAANTTSQSVEDALNEPWISSLQRTDPEAFYAGRSIAVYPTRECRPWSKDWLGRK